MKDIVQWLTSSSGLKSERSLHSNGLLSTLSQHYFLFLGTLSAQPAGVKMLEKCGVFQRWKHTIYINFIILAIWECTDNNTFRKRKKKNLQKCSVPAKLEHWWKIATNRPFSQTVMTISTVFNIVNLEKVFIFSFLTFILCYNTLALNYRKVVNSAVRVFVIQRLRE